MSIYSAKHRIVTATILVAGLQCGLVVPSVATEAPVTTHSAVQKTTTLDATPNQTEQNPEVQGAASTITMKAQLKDDGYLLRWTGFPEDLEASSVLADVNFYTPSGEYGGSVLESPTLTEGTKEGEFRLRMSPATDSNVVYVIVLEDTVHGASYEFFVTERGSRLVETADPRNGKAKPTEPPVDIEREEGGAPEETATPSPGAVSLPSPTATDTVRRTVDNPQNKDSGQYVISEDNSVYDPMNQRKGKAYLSIQDSQGDSRDDTKPVTVRATNFPQNDKGYDLIVMEIDSNGNTVGDALAIVHVGPESISAGAFEAVIGVPGASLQIGKTYLVAAFGAAGAGGLDGALPQPVGQQPKRLYPSPLNEAIYRTYRAPYAHSAWREGVRNFVGDIPTGADVPSYTPMQRIAEQIRGLDVPAFFQWGTKDPVFQRRYLFDLMERMPQAKVHRYEKASHLVIEDYDIASPMISWLAQTFGTLEDGALVPPHNVEAEHRAARARSWHHDRHRPRAWRLRPRRGRKRPA